NCTTPANCSNMLVLEGSNSDGGGIKLGPQTATDLTVLFYISGNARNSNASGNWAASSDMRLKNVNGPYEKGLKEILQLKTVRYHYKPENPDGADPAIEHVGYIAQDVLPVFPEAVPTRPDGYYSLDENPI